MSLTRRVTFPGATGKHHRALNQRRSGEISPGRRRRRRAYDGGAGLLGVVASSAALTEFIGIVRADDSGMNTLFFFLDSERSGEYRFYYDGPCFFFFFFFFFCVCTRKSYQNQECCSPEKIFTVTVCGPVANCAHSAVGALQMSFF